MSGGNWRGWLFLAAMIALLAGMGFALLPAHADMIMIGWMSWAWIVIVSGTVICRGRAWRWADLLRERE
jgi:hypothetical protein